MKHEILPNGDLRFSLDESDDAEEIRRWSRERQPAAWVQLLEECRLIGNGWGAVAPEWIAALTDAPIITDDLGVDDDGTHHVCGRVWWFPNYCVEDPLETLADKGSVTFTLVAKLDNTCQQGGVPRREVLRCDMKMTCTDPVTHIDSKGFIYCAKHGEQRRGVRPCRVLLPSEIARLEAGDTVRWRSS